MFSFFKRAKPAADAVDNKVPEISALDKLSGLGSYVRSCSQQFFIPHEHKMSDMSIAEFLVMQEQWKTAFEKTGMFQRISDYSLMNKLTTTEGSLTGDSSIHTVRHEHAGSGSTPSVTYASNMKNPDGMRIDIFDQFNTRKIVITQNNVKLLNVSLSNKGDILDINIKPGAWMEQVDFDLFKLEQSVKQDNGNTFVPAY